MSVGGLERKELRLTVSHCARISIYLILLKLYLTSVVKLLLLLPPQVSHPVSDRAEI